MTAELENEIKTPPTTYEDWLTCFDWLKSVSFFDNDTAMTITKGSFVNRGHLSALFHQELAETISAMLNRRITRFLKELNILISFNELLDIVPLFVKFRNEIRKCMFFTDFGFLDETIKTELEQSTKTQMNTFWNDTVAFLQKQALAQSNADLEDSLMLIRRMQLFTQVV